MITFTIPQTNMLPCFSQLLRKHIEKDSNDRKRKRTEASSESDILMVVKSVLDTVFADSKLRWKSGEKATNSTKRSRIVNELVSSNNDSCSNVMGRRSDLVLTNRRGIDLCLVEVKNGSSHHEETAQDSKSIRCTKSLHAYNTALSDQRLWSMNWNGYEGDIYYASKYEGVDVILAGDHLTIPAKANNIDDFKDTLVAIYKFKEQMIAYDQSITDTRIYHSP